MKTELTGYLPEELEEEMKCMGAPAYRARQIFEWIHRKKAASFDEMVNLPKELIGKLKNKYGLYSVTCEEKIVSTKDGTEKYLWRLKDGNAVESVLIKAGSRKTLCLSTQAGCRIGCPFCASGINGFKRNLETAEIIAQVQLIGKDLKEPVTNIVFMGMGEPLDNYDNVEKAIRLINHPDGIGIGARKITVSTCGLLPGINKLAKLDLQINLSISLHAASDELRDKLVPINKKYSLYKLIDTCKNYLKMTGRKITLEYTVMERINDTEKSILELADIAKELNAKVNLISCNEPTKTKKGPKKREAVNRMKEKLLKRGALVTIRRSRGEDVFAACGQLAGARDEG